jgi:hypothetical protein
MRRERIVGACIAVGVLTGIGSYQVLAAPDVSAGSAGGIVATTESPSPSPTPGGRFTIGVKMYPQDHGFAQNTEPAHALGEWYRLAGDADYPNYGVRLDTGRYLVWFPGRSARGDVLVVGAATGRCTALGWVPSPAGYLGVDVDVACYDRSGAAVDAGFTATYAYPGPVAG